MEHEVLSKELLGGLLILLFSVRFFFTIKSRLRRGRSPGEVSVIVPEMRANFIFRRFVVVPALSASIFLFYNQPSWMTLFSIPLPLFGMYIGGILGLCGTTLLVWVHVLLGKHWSARMQLRSDHFLIQTGPYSMIRHPMYTSLFTIYLSIGLVSANYLILLLMIMAVLSINLRIPKEEEMMIERFGAEYESYMSRTGRLFPKCSALRRDRF